MQKLLFSFDITSARLEFEKHWKLASLTVKLNLKQNIVSLVCIYIYIYIYIYVFMYVCMSVCLYIFKFKATKVRNMCRLNEN